MITTTDSIYNPIKVFLLYLFFLISNLAGREIISTDVLAIPRIKYYHIFFIMFSVLNYQLFFKKFPYKKMFYFTIFVSLIPFSRGLIAGHEGVYNFLAVDFTLVFFLWGYFYLDNEEKLLTFIKFLVICFVLNYIYKEYLFLGTGRSILFTLSKLRVEEGIRQSSDTFNSLGLISFVFVLMYKYERITKYICGFLLLYIIFRYGIRGSFVALFFVGVYYFAINKIQILDRLFFRNYKFILIVSFAAILLPFIYYQDFFKRYILSFFISGVDNPGTFSWRLAVWYDSLTSFVKSGSILVGISGLPIKYYLTRHIGFRGYVNPHNSYIFLLVNYGFLFLTMYLIIPFNIVFKDKLQNDNKIILTSKLIIVIFLGLSLTTAIFEVPYQGSTFWFVVGGAYGAIKDETKFNKESSVYSDL